MTPSAIESAARRRLNAVSSQFWSSQEIIEECLYFAALDLCTKVKCYEKTSTASSVVSTASYSKPSGCIEIKQVTYDGQKLEVIPERQYFALNLTGTTPITGRPQWYFLWGSEYVLYPTPDEAKTISIRHTAEPTAIDLNTDLSAIIPSQFHPRLVNGVAYYMLLKETDDPRIPIYENRWLNRDIPDCIDEWRRMKHADKMPRVQLEETLLSTETGMV